MIRSGAFVWTYFPTRELPREPGLLHLTYCFAVAGDSASRQRALAYVAYTTTTIPAGDAKQFHHLRIFSAQEAAALNQKRFALHCDIVARLPLTRRWFPRLDTPTEGVVAQASPGLRQDLLRRLTEFAARRPELQERRGV